MKKSSISTRFAIVVALALGLVACEDDVVSDPTFRQWCGDTLCSWTLEVGSIRRAPTWHRDDYGVEFTGTPTRISQYSDKNPSCLLFTSVADVDPRAQMTVEIDFNSDGKVDFEWPVPSSQWHQVQTLVTAPRVPQGAFIGAWTGFTIAIRKTGPGRAVLAQMRVQASKDCDRSTATKVAGIPLGALCGTDADCSTGVCCHVYTTASFKIEGLGICSTCCPSLKRCTGDRCGTTCEAPSICRTTKLSDQLDAHYCGPRFLQKGEACKRADDCESGSCGSNFIIPDGGWNSEEQGPFEPAADGCNAGGSLQTGCTPELALKTYCR